MTIFVVYFCIVWTILRGISIDIYQNHFQNDRDCNYSQKRNFIIENLEIVHVNLFWYL